MSRRDSKNLSHVTPDGSTITEYVRPWCSDLAFVGFAIGDLAFRLRQLVVEEKAGIPVTTRPQAKILGRQLV